MNAPDELEPCFEPDCRCCTSWTAALETLRQSIARHVSTEVRIAPCSPDCLVCADVDWQGAQAAPSIDRRN